MAHGGTRCYTAAVRKTALVLAVALAAGSNGCSADRVVVESQSTAPALPTELPETCEAGTMPSLASNACEPVGPTACGAGFEPSSSRWGCSAVLPEAACRGATRAALGQTSCAPIDDCDRAFPPANADVVVHDAASLTEALANVRNGGTIALDSGTYGAIEVPLDLHDLHFVGRCADKVKVKGTGQRGFYVASTLKVSLESMTIEGFSGGIVAAWGADVRASNVVVRDAQVPLTAGNEGAKLFVKDSVVELTKGFTSGAAVALEAIATGSITVEGLEVRGYGTFSQAVEAGSAIVARRSVFTYEGDAENTQMIFALAGSDTRFEDSALRFRRGKLAYVARELPGIDATALSGGGNLHFENSTVTHAGADLDGPLATVHDGGHVSLEGTTLEHQSASAWMVGNETSSITTKDSVIRSVVKTDTQRNAIWVLRGGSADLDNTAIVNAQQNALVVSHRGSRMTLKKSLVFETFAGRSETDPEFGAAGIGVLAAADATLALHDSAIVYSRHHGVLAAENAQVEIAHSIIDATRTGPEGTGGAGVGAVVARVVMDDSLVRASQDVALVFVGAEGIVKRTRFVDNPVGVHISEMKIIDATEDPQSSSKGELVFFQNVWGGTQTLVREAPYEDEPTDMEPHGY